jgi:multisubunit Na+/H+ antiporter MnhC subunit
VALALDTSHLSAAAGVSLDALRRAANPLANIVSTGFSGGGGGGAAPAPAPAPSAFRANRLDPLPQAPASGIPTSILIGGGVAALLVVGLVVYKLKKKKKR